MKRPLVSRIFQLDSGRLRAGWRALLFFIFSAGLASLFLGLFDSLSPFVRKPFFIEGSLLLLTVLLSESAFRWLDGEGTLGLLPTLQKIKEGFKGVLWGGGSLLLSALPALLLGAISPGDGLAERLASSFTLTGAFLLFTIAALMEEVVFRGYVFRTLAKGITIWGAMAISAFLFSFVHWAQVAGNPPVLFGLFATNVLLAGWWMGRLYIRTGNLWMAWWAHMAWNYTQGTVLGVAVSGTGIGSGDRASTLSGLVLLTGGDIGIEASIPGLFVLIALVWWEERLAFKADRTPKASSLSHP
ncbi:CPBP family intramembrane metalloprotease [bacterium]|nr:CPBP family intramembrane metalloprotease [bacterium]